MVVGNGGSVFLYVTGHQPRQVEKVVHFLQSQPFCGVVLAAATRGRRFPPA